MPEPVDFLLEALLHVPAPPDLDACVRILQRVLPDDVSRPDEKATRRVVGAQYDFPEGSATSYAFVATQPPDVAPAWRAPAGLLTLRIEVVSHHVPQERAEDLAKALRDAMVACAKRLDAHTGYVDVGHRQSQPVPPTPWVTFRRAERGWAWVALAGTRATNHRARAFPDGLVEGKLGLRPKPRKPTPACLLVAGVVLPDGPDAQERARSAGLRVWHVEFVTAPPRSVAGLLVASLDLSQFRADVEPDLAAEVLQEARERLDRIGLGTQAGLLLARVRDLEAA